MSNRRLYRPGCLCLNATLSPACTTTRTEGRSNYIINHLGNIQFEEVRCPNCRPIILQWQYLANYSFEDRVFRLQHWLNVSIATLQVRKTSVIECKHRP